eukprot:TRINITY_DN4581_c0_g2_i1.p1 TRINITY_DN4581_c0_g2~~TRINITY_DN4581_c0_g2_i1.p1  ORF type:complete len:446 (+),score=105.66 TRINITY_DN4581_c0_g2_i1:89-1426(+)
MASKRIELQRINVLPLPDTTYMTKEDISKLIENHKALLDKIKSHNAEIVAALPEMEALTKSKISEKEAKLKEIEDTQKSKNSYRRADRTTKVIVDQIFSSDFVLPPSEQDMKLTPPPKPALLGLDITKGRDYEYYSVGYNSNIVAWAVKQKENGGVDPDDEGGILGLGLETKLQSKFSEWKEMAEKKDFKQLITGEKLVVGVKQEEKKEPEKVNPDRRPKPLASYVITVLGLTGCGKSSLVRALLKEPFNTAYTPTTFQTLKTELTFENEKGPGEFWDLTFNDTMSESYSNKLTLAIKTSNCILLCFSLVDYQSYLASTRIAAIIKNNMDEQKPIIMVGTKGDLLQQNQATSLVPVNNTTSPSSTDPVNNAFYYNQEQALRYSAELGCCALFECSSSTGVGVDEVMLELSRYKWNKFYGPQKKRKVGIFEQLERKKDELLNAYNN